MEGHTRGKSVRVSRTLKSKKSIMLRFNKSDIVKLAWTTPRAYKFQKNCLLAIDISAPTTDCKNFQMSNLASSYDEL